MSLSGFVQFSRTESVGINSKVQLKLSDNIWLEL